MGLRNNGIDSRPILKSEIEYAQQNCLSAAECSRFLGIAFSTYKRYAQLYGIYDDLKNMGAKGTHKMHYSKRHANIQEIFDGKRPHYSWKLFRDRLIKEAIIDEVCMRCGFKERRITDFKVPLVLVPKDGDESNYSKENLDLICYNCSYLIYSRNWRGMKLIPNTPISPMVEPENIDDEWEKEKEELLKEINEG